MKKLLTIIGIMMILSGCGFDGTMGVVAKTGDTGDAGAMGLTGIQGATGATGVTGQNGYNTLINATYLATPRCPSGHGTLIESGLDTDISGYLDMGEVTATTMVCDGSSGQNGTSCSVEQTGFGATIICEDGTQANIYNGQDGIGCSIVQTETGADVTCGDSTVNIANGTDGNPGADGSSCSAITMGDNTKYVVCTDGSSFQVFDGINGTNGTNGQDGIIAIIDPCGKQSNTDEIFLKLSTGQIIAVYADQGASKIHLVELVEGSWVTTDGTKCYFSVNSEGDIYNMHN